MTKTIAINAGSSSLKWQLYEMPDEVVLAKGLIERIGLKDSVSTVKFDDRSESQTLDIADHVQAVKILLDDLIRFDIIKSYDEITGVGHRVVAGGEYFKESSLVDEDALAKINAQPLVKNLPSSALLVQLKYAGSSTDEPLLTELFKEYGVSSNILYGNVEILGDTPVGELVVVLDGEADKVLAAQKAIENAGVSLQVLKKGAQ